MGCFDNKDLERFVSPILAGVFFPTLAFLSPSIIQCGGSCQYFAAKIICFALNVERYRLLRTRCAEVQALKANREVSKDLNYKHTHFCWPGIVWLALQPMEKKMRPLWLTMKPFQTE